MLTVAFTLHAKNSGLSHYFDIHIRTTVQALTAKKNGMDCFARLVQGPIQEV